MLPKSLSKRIFLAFAALGVAMLLTVSASLFVVLRNAHQDDIKKTLGYEVVAIEASLLANPVSDQGSYEGRITKLTTSIVDDGGFVLVQGPRGLVRIVAGIPSSADMPPPPAAGVKNAIGTLRTSDGKQFVYIQPNANATGNYRFVFAMPDNSIQLALSDLVRTLGIIVIVLLLVGLPIAWLLARSVTAPMRRLAQAARDLPAASGEIKPLPLEGPTEVKALTERFNAMAHELASTRHEETALLANLRHDLRTPLTSISGFAEAIADGTASGDRATAAARTIAEEAQRLERLVGELGVVERLRDGAAALRPEALDATELLRQAATRFETRAASAGVEVDVGATSPGELRLVFTGDRLAAERILQNLIENALSMLPQGGHIWLRAAPLAMPGRPPGISLSVTDDGPGFPPGTTEKVFERFFRADPSRSGSGSGLGLAIVRELARAHGGEAWAENVAPRGARVTVLLPIQPVASAAPKPTAAAEE
jgi:two-component system, OmpR family, sensor kinase